MSLARKKKLLVYGAGAIGRGFLPWVFSPDEFDYFYVERNQTIRETLERDKSFITYKTSKQQDKTNYETLKVPVRRCFVPGEEIESINDFSVVVTAVGPRNILSLGDSLKGTRMPVVCCENDSSIPALLESVTHNPNVVFAIPDVITSNTASDEMLQSDPLSIITEDGICYVDDHVSEIGGKASYISKKELEKQWKAKLYLHNTPHCIAAYLGSLLKVRYVHEVMNIPKAREIIAGAMREMQVVLLKKFNIKKEFVDWYADKELGRFSNSLLFDPISRVAREPFRKLAPSERLLGAAQLCMSIGVNPKYVSLGIMAAFFYNNHNDPDLNIRYLIRSIDTPDFLRIVMQLSPDQALHQLLLEQWDHNKKTLNQLYE